MGAIGERIAIAAFAGIAQLRRACAAERRIRRDLGACGSADAFGDTEFLWQTAAVAPPFDAVDMRERRRVSFDSSKQRSDARRVAADAHQYALAVVENLAGKPKFARHAPDGRAKADALDAAAHSKFERLRWLYRRKTHDRCQPHMLLILI